MKKIIFLIFISVIFLFNFCQISTAKTKKQSQKKIKNQKIRMIETKEEWEEKSQNVPLEARELNNPVQQKETTKKFYYPKPYYIIERYNYPQGSRELNIEDVKKDCYSYPFIVASPDFSHVAYSRYFFSPDVNQISSEFYVEELNKKETKINRMLKYHHNQKNRKPILTSGTKEIYPNLFNGLSVVDWNNDGTKVLIKEKIGSTLNGIYKTYLYVYIMPTEIASGSLVKLEDFSQKIEQYFLEYENKLLKKYRYDIIPLGFSAEDENVIIAHCFVLDKSGNKLFMGTWGYNFVLNETLLYSKDDPIFPLESNGLILKEVYN